MKNYTNHVIITAMVSFLSITTSSAQTFTRSIAQSSDDAEEKQDGSFVTTSSSDLELVYDSWNSQGLQTVGLRFTSILVPANSVITNAYIQFTADGDNSGAVDMTLKGERVANSPTFTNNPSNISSRTMTTATVNWTSIPQWQDNQNGNAQRTPNLSAIVTEIISSNGWAIGNPLTFILSGTGSASALRKAFSFDGSAANAPQLVIEYVNNMDTDLALTSCLSPPNVQLMNPATPITVTLTNFGNLVANNYTLSYYINGNLVATEALTTPIPYNQTLNHTFAQTANFGTVGTYALDIRVQIDNDENSFNDVITKNVTVVNETEQLFFNQGTHWRYWDQATNPGINWNSNSYSDLAWPLGIGQMGFGEGDEQTVLSTNNASYYFRKKVNIPDVSQLNEVYLRIIHDDAAIVYVNGQEVVRSELMPLGPVTHTTTARQPLNDDLESTYFTYRIPPAVFANGDNIIAIAIKNEDIGEEDLSFNCFLTPAFQYSSDGPYVFYEGDSIIVKNVIPSGVVRNAYHTSEAANLTFSCQLPFMNENFSFSLKPQLTIEPSIDTATPSKFLSISDFDGHIEAFTMVLRGEGIIDDNFNWIYGNGHLIISGDLFDRGFHITECLWLLYKLESEAEAQGGKVHLIIGNHEMMNLNDDWRYVEVKYFDNSHLMGKRMLELYSSDTELGRWLRTKNIMERIGGYAFVHGGLSPEVAALNLSYDQINNYGRIVMDGSCPNNDCEVVTGSDGVYWYRGMAEEELTQTQVDAILDGFGVRRVIFGHTKDNTIRSLYQGRVFAIDMYHIYNFQNGFMEALQFELGCFYLFHTDGTTQTYTLLGACDVAGTDEPDQTKSDVKLKIVPNPSSSSLSILFSKELVGNYAFSISDTNGKIVRKGMISKGSVEIDISMLTEGTYQITLENDQATITGSFILSKY